MWAVSCCDPEALGAAPELVWGVELQQSGLTLDPGVAASSQGGLGQLTRLRKASVFSPVKWELNICILYLIGRRRGLDERKPLHSAWNMAILRKQEGHYYFYYNCHHQRCLSVTSWASPVTSEVPKAEWTLKV